MGRGQRREEEDSKRNEHKMWVRFSDWSIVRRVWVMFSDGGRRGAGIWHWNMTWWRVWWQERKRCRGNCPGFGGLEHGHVILSSTPL